MNHYYLAGLQNPPLQQLQLGFLDFGKFINKAPSEVHYPSVWSRLGRASSNNNNNNNNSSIFCWGCGYNLGRPRFCSWECVHQLYCNRIGGIHSIDAVMGHNHHPIPQNWTPDPEIQEVGFDGCTMLLWLLLPLA